MYIAPKDIGTKGFKKWSDAQQPEPNTDVRTREGDGVIAADPDLENRVMTAPSGRIVHGWSPGVGRL
jgi:hypothetical protein